MSKRSRPTSKKFREKHPRNVGDFLKVFDAKGGHPARVYFADPVHDTYFIQRFTKHGRKDREKLDHNIDPESSEEQWLVKKPEAVSYDDMKYNLDYQQFRIHPDDVEKLLKYQRFDLTKKDERGE